MKIKVLESKPTYIKFIVEETDPATANALRRTLVADIPKMAIEDVEFHLGRSGARTARNSRASPLSSTRSSLTASGWSRFPRT